MRDLRITSSSKDQDALHDADLSRKQDWGNMAAKERLVEHFRAAIKIGLSDRDGDILSTITRSRFAWCVVHRVYQIAGTRLQMN